jgi:hypothetical protein
MSKPPQKPGDSRLFTAEEVEEFPRLPINPRANYARVPFSAGFNVPVILDMAAKEGNLPRGHVMYIVDFGSLLKPDADRELIANLDNAAHREAKSSAGFLLYFRGDLDPQGYNRSFCVWRSKDDAKTAAHRPNHMTAVNAAKEMYIWYRITMREAWLEKPPLDFGFGVETTRLIGNDQLPK